MEVSNILSCPLIGNTNYSITCSGPFSYYRIVSSAWGSPERDPALLLKMLLSANWWLLYLLECLYLLQNTATSYNAGSHATAQRLYYEDPALTKRICGRPATHKAIKLALLNVNEQGVGFFISLSNMRRNRCW